MAGKWARLDQALASAGLDALVVEDLPGVRYVTGYSPYLALASFHGQLALYRQGSGEPVLFPQTYYVLFARARFPWNAVERVEPGQWPTRAAAVLRAWDARTVGLVGASLTFGRAIEEAAGGLKLVEADRVLAEVRAVKTPAEIAVMRRAMAIAEAGLAAAQEAVRPGAREVEVAAESERAMRRLAAEPHVMALRGANAAILQEVSTDDLFRPGDLALLDLGCYFEGYRAEFARTVVVGSPSARQRAAGRAVYETLQVVLQLLRPGRTTGDLHAAAMDSLARAGFAEYAFDHPLGHGLGVTGGEPPAFSAGGRARLLPGMVVNVEPGVFIPEEEIGVRLEEVVLITESGHEMLSRAPFDERLIGDSHAL